MLAKIFNTLIYAVVFFSLFFIDYLLGNGFVDVLRKAFCKITCFVRQSIKKQAKVAQLVTAENPISVPMMLVEVLALFLTITVLKKYKTYHSEDRMDELLQESRDALAQTNQFLEKWRLRRINSPGSAEYSYLDDEPQEIKPLNMEVPILHMAIIDTLGARTQQHRSDAGDAINFTDSTLLSVTSLLDDDAESIQNISTEEKTRNTEMRRYLWDVTEED